MASIGVRWWNFGLSSFFSRPRGIQSVRPGRYNTPSASSVSVDTALQVSAVWACTKLLTECISTVPLEVYKKDAKGVLTPWPDHMISELFSGKLNKTQNRVEFFEVVIPQLLLLGNFYALIQRNGAKEIIGLVPFDAEQMQVVQDEFGDITYQYQDQTGLKIYAPANVWHVKQMGNGLVGMSTLAYARNSIGVGQAADNSVTKIFSNGAKPSGVLTIDKTLTDKQREQIKAAFAGLKEGTEDRLFVLEAGMEYHQVSMTPQDIELLATRRFQIEDIARFFGVPSVLINDTTSTTVWGSGIQQIIQGFYKTGLRPYLERIQESILQSLVDLEDRRNVKVCFDIDALLMPDEASRITSAKEGVMGGILTPDEGRSRIGLAPTEGGDKCYMQQQMVPLDKLGTAVLPKPAPTVEY